MQRVSLRNIAKRQPLGTQCLRLKPGFLVHVAVAVLDVAQHRVPQVSQVRTDLVRAAGNQSNAAERKRPNAADHRYIGDDFFVPLAFMGVNAHLVAFFAVLQPGNMPPGRRGTDGNGQVLFLHPVIADDLVHIPQGRVFFRGNHKPLGAAVQPVADGGCKAVFSLGVIFAAGLQLGTKGIHQVGIAGAVAVAQQVGGLVQHRNVFVLIDHLDRRLAARRLFGRDHRLFGEKLIVDIQLDHITAAQPGVRFTALAVHLNALVAETFIQQAARHVPGHAFHKAGKPHAVFVFACDKLFHGGHILFAIFKQ